MDEDCQQCPDWVPMDHTTLVDRRGHVLLKKLESLGPSAYMDLLMNKLTGDEMDLLDDLRDEHLLLMDKDCIFTVTDKGRRRLARPLHEQLPLR
jgi:hypothetical protein